MSISLHTCCQDEDAQQQTKELKCVSPSEAARGIELFTLMSIIILGKLITFCAHALNSILQNIEVIMYTGA